MMKSGGSRRSTRRHRRVTLTADESLLDGGYQLNIYHAMWAERKRAARRRWERGRDGAAAGPSRRGWRAQSTGGAVEVAGGGAASEHRHELHQHGATHRVLQEIDQQRHEEEGADDGGKGDSGEVGHLS